MRASVLMIGSFQSTHPVRGATPSSFLIQSTKPVFQSTHPVRGATSTRRGFPAFAQISIHAPRAGCDGYHLRDARRSAQFQSTHPVRGATHGRCIDVQGLRISIHAPRAGCDGHRRDVVVAHHHNFNPRTPCGVRRCSVPDTSSDATPFQSTHPVRGATDPQRSPPQYQTHFNPRTPCGVRHVTLEGKFTIVLNFNPRTPCGVRPPRREQQ